MTARRHIRTWREATPAEVQEIIAQVRAERRATNDNDDSATVAFVAGVSNFIAFVYWAAITIGLWLLLVGIAAVVGL